MTKEERKEAFLNALEALYSEHQIAVDPCCCAELSDLSAESPEARRASTARFVEDLRRMHW